MVCHKLCNFSYKQVISLLSIADHDRNSTFAAIIKAENGQFSFMISL